MVRGLLFPPHLTALRVNPLLSSPFLGEGPDYEGCGAHRPLPQKDPRKGEGRGGG
jgi:hypothetical protein